jgi:hypothetical protein
VPVIERGTQIGLDGNRYPAGDPRLYIRPEASTALIVTTGRGRRWYGDGPPTVVVGAALGDEYVDRQTGDLYILN